ncbi:HET domain containing protein [Rhypophila decipiens]
MSKRKREEAWPESRDLCRTCASMTSTPQALRSLISAEGYVHLTKKAIRKSALRCSLCSILRSYRAQPGTAGNIRIYARLDHESTKVADGEMDHPFRGSKLECLCVDRSSRGSTSGYELQAFTTSNDPAAGFVGVQPLSIPVSSDAIIERIQERLAHCQSRHHKCNSEHTAVLPKRVVDVGTLGYSKMSPRLHLNKTNQRDKYIALSYCWGGPQEIMTTSSTLQSHTLSLPKSLPQTIQDAVTVTRRLGFRYLWVDALCIIQDDQTDISTEISSMGLIYKNATLTIAAASATTVKDGFLQNRSVSGVCRLPLFLNDLECGSLWLRNPSMEHAKEPLDTRAWALQEFLLSPRILYFATKDLLWKCQSDKKGVAVEETHNPYYGILTTSLPDDVFMLSQWPSRSSNQARVWNNIISNYSGRKLQISDDRLPALAGIASELQKIWNDQYIAGMWRGSFVRQLGWVQSWGRDQKNPTGAPYRSPGWS